jgi:hypothetical protein
MTAAIATIGHNQPPPTPYESVSAEISDLYGEASLWLDGAEVADQGTADGLAKLLILLREARDRADEARKAEAKPFDDAKAEIQARYNLLIGDTKAVRGKVILAMEACKKALAPWLAKIEAEKREAADKARREAEEKQRAAQEAIRAAQSADLAAREEAEALVREAKKAESAAKAAEKDTAKADGGGKRAVSLRSVYTPVLLDATAAARHYWKTHRASMDAFLIQLAEQDVRNGTRSIPGFEIKEEKVAV